MIYFTHRYIYAAKNNPFFEWVIKTKEDINLLDKLNSNIKLIKTIKEDE